MNQPDRQIHKYRLIMMTLKGAVLNLTINRFPANSYEHAHTGMEQCRKQLDTAQTADIAQPCVAKELNFYLDGVSTAHVCIN